MFHLVGGLAIISLLWLIFLRYNKFNYFKPITDIRFDIPKRKIKNLYVFAYLTLIVLVMLIMLGGWTSTNYASYSCTDFPLCQCQILPDANFKQGFDFFQSIGPNYLGGQMDHDSRVAIHLTHRFGAIVVTLFLLFMSYLLYIRKFQTLALGLVGFLILQVLLGISNVIFALPLLVAVGHNLGGLLLITYLGVLRLREN